jgi:hypothetical protein
MSKTLPAAKPVMQARVDLMMEVAGGEDFAVARSQSDVPGAARAGHLWLDDSG